MNVCVIGTAAIDITAKTIKGFVPNDSNPSNISMSPGGVARNVAHNLALLKLDVRFLTTFADDIYSKEIISGCNELNFDISHAKHLKNSKSPIYLCINDNMGNLMAGAADMEIANEINTEYIKENIAYINSSDCVFFDTNINKDTLDFMFHNITVPIFMDLVSTKKTDKLKELLQVENVNVHTLKANDLEASTLVGYKIKTDHDLIEASNYLHEKGFKRVFITLGKKGVFCSEKGKFIKLPSLPVNVLSDTGAGDSFLATLIYSFDKGYDLEKSAQCATLVAKKTLESMSAINENLSPDILEGF